MGNGTKERIANSKDDSAGDVRMEYYRRGRQEYGRRYREYHWPSMEIFLELASTHDVVTSHFAHKLAGHSLSRAGLNVLAILNRSEARGLKHNELSRLLLVSRANVTGLVDSLCSQGLVERKLDDKDRRACMVCLTSKGQKFLDDLLPGHYKEIARIFSCLKPREKAALNKLLSRIRGQLGEIETKG